LRLEKSKAKARRGFVDPPGTDARESAANEDDES